MIKSMTGFGSATITSENYNIQTDIKSVNSRNLDINIRGPRSIMFVEDKLNSIISKYIKRGYVQVFINIEHIGEQEPDFVIDYNLAKAYGQNLNKLSQISGINRDYSILDLLSYDNSILNLRDTDYTEDEEFIDSLEKAILDSTKNLLEMRVQEGYNIKTDIDEKLKAMYDDLSKISEYSEETVEENINLLRDRIDKFLDGSDISLDEDRLMNEIVFYSDRLTIDEEIVRLNSHINMMKTYLESEDTIGKRLDFIAQEMNREANTIGSKSSSINITNLVIDLKSSIEKIREQVANIE